MRRVWPVILILFAVYNATAADQPTSLPDARNGVEANMRTSEGKAFDQKFGSEFVQKHLGALHDCRLKTSNALRDFWILMKLDKDGGAKEVLLYPETKIGSCAHERLLTEYYVPPPRPDYWVSVFIKYSH